MTVTQAQIDIAKSHGLTNVEGLAAACDKTGLPFYLACTILQKETGGANIYGHDRGAIFSDHKRLEVTEENWLQFKAKVLPNWPKTTGGQTSNGIGPLQITWKGFFPDMEKQGLKPWLPADSIMYGVQLLSQYWRASGSAYEMGRRYNGANSYGTATAELAKVWKTRVGTADLAETPNATPEPVKPHPADDEYVSKAKVPFRGGQTCSCVAKSLPLVEQYMLMMGLIRFNIDIAQLGWRGDVDASKGTHAKGGCTDTWGQWSAAHIDVWRRCGWTMQRRDLTGIDTHAHGWPYGCPHLSPAAEAQARDWDRRDAGLQGNARVQGRYPIDKWQTAYTKRSKEIAAFKAGVSLTVLTDAFANRTRADDVIALQVALCRHLPEDIVIDGDPGPQTKAALAKVGPLNPESLTALGLEVTP